MALPNEHGREGCRRPKATVEKRTTAELVVRAQAGETESLDALMARYYPRVQQIVRRRLSGQLQRTTSCPDITQESLANAIRAFPSFRMRNGSSLIRWLAKIVENTIRGWRDYVLAHKRRPLVSSESEDPADEDPGPVEGVIAQETCERVRRAVRRLSPTQQRIVHSRHMMGWSWRRVAAAVGKPTGSAARAAHDVALRKLSRYLASMDQDIEAAR